MAAKRLLSCLKKRDLLNSDKLDRAELIGLGELSIRESRFSAAIDFFEKAGHVEGLAQLRERCIAEGDYFLLERLTKIIGEPPGSEDLIRLGDNALRLGKLLFARSAYQQADHPGKLAQVEKLLNLPNSGQLPERDMLH